MYLLQPISWKCVLHHHLSPNMNRYIPRSINELNSTQLIVKNAMKIDSYNNFCFIFQFKKMVYQKSPKMKHTIPPPPENEAHIINYILHTKVGKYQAEVCHLSHA